MNYAIVSPVRNEADNLPRLTESIRAQTVQPVHWVIVDTGSDDDTIGLAEATGLPYSLRTDSVSRGESDSLPHCELEADGVVHFAPPEDAARLPRPLRTLRCQISTSAQGEDQLRSAVARCTQHRRGTRPRATCHSGTRLRPRQLGPWPEPDDLKGGVDGEGE